MSTYLSLYDAFRFRGAPTIGQTLGAHWSR